MHATAAGRVRAWEILAVGAMVLGCLATAKAAEQYVDWTNQVNVIARGNSLQKSGGCQGCDDAGATSRQMIRSGDGYVEFEVAEPNTFWLAGLSHANGQTQFSRIDYAFRFNGNGHADVMENGAYLPGADTMYAPGDRFRVAVVRGRVQYVKNGSVLRESDRPPRYPVFLKASLGTVGATIANARIETNDRALTTQNRYDYQSDRLATLDRNADGMISRLEWQGSRREFDLLDLNRDGRLNAREMSRGEPESAGTTGELVVVDPTERWTDTGIWVEAGAVISFDAEGTIQMSDNPSDTATPAGSGRRAVDAPLRTRPAGSLIARIGNSAPVLVGNYRTTRAPASGQLFLGVNDDHLLDNSGEYRVTVTVQPR